MVNKKGTRVEIGRTVEVASLECALTNAAREVKFRAGILGNSWFRDIKEEGASYELQGLGNNREARIGDQLTIYGTFLPALTVKIYHEGSMGDSVKEFYISNRGLTEREIITYLSAVKRELNKMYEKPNRRRLGEVMTRCMQDESPGIGGGISST